MIPADVESFVIRKFAAEDVPGALEILAEAVTHTGVPAEPRLLRCAVFASDKTLRGLKYQVAGLAIDYRDVILAAEYRRKDGKSVQVRDFLLPIANDA